MSLRVQPEEQNQWKQILRDLLQAIVLVDCGNWLGNSKIHRAGHQEKQAGSLEPVMLSTGDISSSEKP